MRCHNRSKRTELQTHASKARPVEHIAHTTCKQPRPDMSLTIYAATHHQFVNRTKNSKVGYSQPREAPRTCNDGRKGMPRAEGDRLASLRTALHITMTDTSCIQSVALASPLCKKSRPHTTRTTSITADLPHASRPHQPPAVCASSSQEFCYNNTTPAHRQRRRRKQQKSKQTQRQSLTSTSTSTSCTALFELDSSQRTCDKSVKLPRHTHYAMRPLHGQ